MTGKELIKKILDQNLLDKEVFVNILLCDPSDSKARQYRFHINSFGYGYGEDILDTNYGIANEININQNESLRSWNES